MQSSPGGSARKGLSSSPATSKKAFDGSSPASQYVRGSNTLGVASPTTRHSSMPGVAEGTPSLKPARASFSKKRLDPSDPSTWTSSHKPSFSERPRAASETIQRAEGPAINLESDADRAQGDRSAGVNLDGSSVAQDQATSAETKKPKLETALSPESTVVSSPPESQKSPTVSNADPASPETKNMAPPSPKGLGLAVPQNDSPDNRRFSNQSASFSSVNTDSDRVGRTSYESDRDNENVLQETSDESSSSSGSSDEEEEEEEDNGERGRKRKSDRGSKSPERRVEESPKEPASPVIRVEDMSDNKQDHPHPIDDSGKMSETKPKHVAPKSGIRRAPSPAALSATGDDDAELRRAKELVVKTSPVDETVTDRSVKMIIRGEWESFQDVEDEETEFRHEPRLYLVCSDLSSEASHALEWTVGTLLKDGDTLLIISAIEDENAPKHKPDEEPSAEIKMESVKAAQQAGAIMESLTRQTTNREGTKQELLNTRVASVKDADARSQSRGSRSRPGSRRGHDRVQAIERLEQDFMKFVRKTTLQVRTMIEVLHCRSSRHLMLNAIDELEPTLVVVGTRGQSSIQGVMMGSFSNYLVTKSSVPVMVARRRLKKPHHAKISSQQIRLTNNLIPFGVKPKRRSLTSARID